MRGFEFAAAMGNDGNIVRGRHGRDTPQLGQPAAPVYVRLPDGRRAVLQELAEPVPRVLVLAGGDLGGLDPRVQSAEPGVVVRRQNFLAWSKYQATRV